MLLNYARLCNSEEFLNLNNGIYDFKVYRKTTKQPTHWSSKITKRYKRNGILGDLHRSKI